MRFAFSTVIALVLAVAPPARAQHTGHPQPNPGQTPPVELSRALKDSHTSGMKAAHNGVPSLSTLVGWWREGHIEGVTGWSIGPREIAANRDLARGQDAEDLYRKLKTVIVPMFYRERERWEEIMQHAIALNASLFNTHRIVQQYVTNAYLA